MVDGRLRFMLATALIFIMTTLSALGAVADSGVDFGLTGFPSLPELGPVFQEPEPPPPLPPFAERLESAGSVEALMASAVDGWVPVAPGVDYSLFQIEGPVNVHVARMLRSNLDLFLETSIGQGRLSGGVERTSNQFARYEGAINYWGETWGNTNDVLVAINGSFYDVFGVPDRGMIQSGWYAKRFDNLESGSGFVWKLDRTAFIGECVTHTPSKQVITYMPGTATETFQGINIERDGEDELIVYTAHYDDSTGTDDEGVEIIVRLERPMLMLPPPSMALGTVVQIRDEAGDSKLYFDHIVLSATGIKAANLLANLGVGSQLGISNSVTDYGNAECIPPATLDWTKAYASLGGSYYFLQDGVITSPGPTPLNPLTAIAFNPEYIFFIVVDGRDPGVSIGMTIGELAEFAQGTLGATFGISQDGGGSSTMVIDGVVVNTPSDLTPVACPNTAFLPIAVKGGGGSEPVAPPGDEEFELPECFIHVERSVANGIMMVALVPRTLSTMFFEGAGVVALEPAEVRLGPGSNYAEFATVAEGTDGVVQGNANGMNGVFAKGEHWWLVKFGSVTGWVAEVVLGAAP